MEKVFFYEYSLSKDVKKSLESKIDGKTDDYLSHIDYIIRDSKLLNSDKKGYFLYISGDKDQIDYIESKLQNIKIEKIEGDERDCIIKGIKGEEENAASGMGMIFG